MGGGGAGQLTKMVNQICIAGLLQGLSEGMNFALKAGLQPEKVVDVISKPSSEVNGFMLPNISKVDPFYFSYHSALPSNNSYDF